MPTCEKCGTTLRLSPGTGFDHYCPMCLTVKSTIPGANEVLDPEKALEELARIHAEGGPKDFERLLELFMGLDIHLRNGGDPPESWRSAFIAAMRRRWVPDRDKETQFYDLLQRIGDIVADTNGDETKKELIHKILEISKLTVKRDEGFSDADPKRIGVFTPLTTDADTIGLGPFTTVRACVDCGVLISGGPTRCLYCASKLVDPEQLALRPLPEKPKEPPNRERREDEQSRRRG